MLIYNFLWLDTIFAVEMPLLGRDDGDGLWERLCFCSAPAFVWAPWATSLVGGGINISMFTWFLKSWME